MFAESKAFSGFAVDDVDAAKRFYGEVLGLTVNAVDDEGQLLQLELAGGTNVFVYGKPGHVPATYTILNFPVDDVERAVDALTANGVAMLRYDGFGQDEKGIARGNGPDIAWFSDPSGNILSVLST
ncbi:MAG TPA: VOC family protein [Nocardioidaceae bacterium]|jgi:predicted enzyme related to lactoylglutathione lyase